MPFQEKTFGRRDLADIYRYHLDDTVCNVDKVPVIACIITAERSHSHSSLWKGQLITRVISCRIKMLYKYPFG